MVLGSWFESARAKLFLFNLFKRAFGSHTKSQDGLFFSLTTTLLLAFHFTFATFRREIGFPVLLESTFYVHSSLFFHDLSMLLMFFVN